MLGVGGVGVAPADDFIDTLVSGVNEVILTSVVAVKLLPLPPLTILLLLLLLLSLLLLLLLLLLLTIGLTFIWGMRILLLSL